jgi:hypothetical protein
MDDRLKISVQVELFWTIMRQTTNAIEARTSMLPHRFRSSVWRSLRSGSAYPRTTTIPPLSNWARSVSPCPGRSLLRARQGGEPGVLTVAYGDSDMHPDVRDR